jgi:hypothetical protein
MAGRLFDDWRSIVHVLAGMFSVAFHVAIPVTLAFIAYEVLELLPSILNARETVYADVREALGDIVEYTVGLMLGGMVGVVAW